MKSYTVGEYRQAIDALAPFSLTQSWDNTGILIGSPARRVERALVALDATAPIIAEAAEVGAQLIVAHHPIIFQGLKYIPEHSPAYRAIRADIAVICAHTNLDIAAGGVNDVLAALLDLRDTEVIETTQTSPYRKVVVYVPTENAQAVYAAMAEAGAGQQGNYAGCAFFSKGQGCFTPLHGASPAIGKVGRPESVDEVRLEMLAAPDDIPAVLRALKSAHPYQEPAFDIFETGWGAVRQGIGRTGSLPQPFTPAGLAAYVKQKLEPSALRYIPGTGEITRVAVCGGAGGSFIEQALAVGAQALITGEAKYSQLLEAREMGLTLIESGHYATEAVVLPGLVHKLKAALPGADIRRASACDDPGQILC